MSIFSYKDTDGKDLIKESLAFNKYSYDLFEGIDSPELEPGWALLTADDMGYSGITGAYGEFWGETLALITSQVNVLGKYDDAGKLTSIGISFWGSGSAANDPDGILQLIADGLVDVGVALGAPGISNGYIYTAFNDLLSCIADFARANGLSGSDVIVSGHSMGGMAVNSMAAGSALGHWDGFYESSSYIAYASPTQNTLDDKVLNIGTENDPIFRVLEGDSLTWDTPFVHDRPQETCTNNLVVFNEFYNENQFYSIANLDAWANGHATKWYVGAINAIMNSSFYDCTNIDSTIIVSALSDENRGTTWVQDLNHYAWEHQGPTFILGSDKNDLLAGGNGMDYLEGGAGNDMFRDAGGYNVIMGGEGIDTYEIQGVSTENSFSRDAFGNLYIKDPSGCISILNSVEQIKGGYMNWLWWTELTYDVTETGLSWSEGFEAYASTQSGHLVNDSTIVADQSAAPHETSWLFGYAGNDILVGTVTDDVFSSAGGNDTMYSMGGKDSFILAGDNFGHDVIYGFDANDTLIFLGNSGFGNTPSYRDYLSTSGDNTIFSINDSSITLVGVSMDQLAEHQFAMA